MRKKLTAVAGMALVIALAVPAVSFADGRTTAFGKGGGKGDGKGGGVGHKGGGHHGGHGRGHGGWGRHGHSNRYGYGYGYPGFYGYWGGYPGYDARFLYGTPYYPYPSGQPGLRDDDANYASQPMPDGALTPAPDPGATAPVHGGEGPKPDDPGKDAAKPAPDKDAKAEPGKDAKPEPDKAKGHEEEPSSDSAGDATSPAGPAGSPTPAGDPPGEGERKKKK